MNGLIVFGIVAFVLIVGTISAVISKLLIGTKEKILEHQEEQEKPATSVVCFETG